MRDDISYLLAHVLGGSTTLRTIWTAGIPFERGSSQLIVEIGESVDAAQVDANHRTKRQGLRREQIAAHRMHICEERNECKHQADDDTLL